MVSSMNISERPSIDSCSDVVLEDVTVSNQHLRIYSILFEQEDVSDIPPLVYAEDLSSNGSYWNGTLMGRGNGGVLLSDGDVLRISPRHAFSYCGVDSLPPEPRDEIQEREKKVDWSSQGRPTEKLTRAAVPASVCYHPTEDWRWGLWFCLCRA